ncbi:MAG: hypothetical protein R3F43_18050 [bacterium]
MTRKFALPKGMSEDEDAGEEAADEAEETGERRPPPPLSAVAEAPLEPAEESFIEALSSTDLDSMLEEAGQSVDRSADRSADLLPIGVPPSAPMEVRDLAGRAAAPGPSPRPKRPTRSWRPTIPRPAAGPGSCARTGFSAVDHGGRGGGRAGRDALHPQGSDPHPGR